MNLFIAKVSCLFSFLQKYKRKNTKALEYEFETKKNTKVLEYEFETKFCTIEHFKPIKF